MASPFKAVPMRGQGVGGTDIDRIILISCSKERAKTRNKSKGKKIKYVNNVRQEKARDKKSFICKIT